MLYILTILSSIIGLGLFYLIKNTKNTLPYILTFSGALLLGIVIFESLPIVYQAGSKKVLIFMILGLLVQLLMEHFSKGLEHGHAHLHHLKFIPAYIALLLHAFLESVAIDGHNHSFLVGILIHKIPVAFVVFSFLSASYKTGKMKYVLFAIFTIIAPLGILLGSYLEAYSSYIMAFVCGLLLHISSIILFESSTNHQIDIKKWTLILAGFIIAYFL